MARVWTIQLPASAFSGDNNAQLVAGDAAAAPVVVGSDRPAWAFDDTDEEAIVSHGLTVPDEYASGTVSADVFIFMASDVTNDVAVDVFVEAVTPGDTLDLEATHSWDAANSGTVSLSGSTAGDLKKITITLSNKDSMAAGDLLRIGVRRDTDSANDDAVGDMYIDHVDIYEAA